jgi:hypothetical protein
METTLSAPATTEKGKTPQQLPNTRTARRRSSLLIHGVEFGVLIVAATFTIFKLQPPFPSPAVVATDMSIVATSDQLQSPVTVVVPDESASDAAIPVTFVFPTDGPFVVSPSVIPAASSAAIAVPSARTASLNLAKSATRLPSGTYTAAIAVVGSTKRQITVNVTDGPFWPVVAVLSGLVISYVITLLVGVVLPGQQLLATAYILREKIRLLSNNGTNTQDPIGRFSLLTTADRLIGTRSSRDDDSIRTQISQGNLQSAQSRLNDLQSLFSAYHAFLYAAADVWDTWEWIRAVTHCLATDAADGGGYQPPVAVLELNEVIGTAGEVREIKDADDLRTLSAKFKTLGDTYVVFRRAYRRYREALNFIAALDRSVLTDCKVPAFEVNNDQTDSPGKTDHDSLAATCRALLAARFDLWTARTADDLTTWNVETQIETQFATIRTIGAKYGKVPREFVTVETEHKPSRRVALTMITRNEQYQYPVPSKTDLSEKALRAYEYVAWGDAAIFGIALIVALLTAMTALYVGKPFGSFADYATAVTWGFGVDQTVKGITATLGKLGINVPTITTITG